MMLRLLARIKQLKKAFQWWLSLIFENMSKWQLHFLGSLMCAMVAIISAQNASPLCSRYNAIKENRLHQMDSKGKLVRAHGQGSSNCGRTFFISYEKNNFEAALETCLNRNMELVSLRNASKFENCVATLDTFQNSAVINATSDFWTSGVRASPDNYVWCSEKLMGADDNFSHGNKQIAALGAQCVKVNESGALEAVNCWQTHRFICEYACSTPQCPKWECNVNRESMESPEAFGQYFYSVNQQRSYLFSMEMVSWSENWKKCCSMNMMPVEFRNRKEIDDVLKQNEVAFHAFWTSGWRAGCDGQVSWCFNQSSAPPTLRLEARLNAGGGLGDCLLISRVQNGSGGVVHEPLLDECDAKVSLACMTNTKPNAIDTTSKNFSGWDYCSTPVCSNFPDCTKNPGYFAQHLLIGPTSFGSIMKACGSYLLLPRFEATWFEAFNYCCSLGMNLVTIFSLEKLQCLYDVLNDEPYERGVTYWTSGQDLDCPGRHRWCTSDMSDFVKAKLVWKKPKSSKSCLYLVLDAFGSDKAKLGTSPCSARSKFICEVRPQARGKLAAVVEECSEVHQLDKSENSANMMLMEMSSFPTNKVKCYLTCLAERMNLLSARTALQENRILQIIRNFKRGVLNVTEQIMDKNASSIGLAADANNLIRSSHELMKKSYSAFYECQSQSNLTAAQANDDCSLIAPFAWCFFEKVPEMKQLMLQYNDTPAEPSPIDLDAFCYETVRTPSKCSSDLCIENKKNFGNRKITKFPVDPPMKYSAARMFCKEKNMHLPAAVDKKEYDSYLKILGGNSSSVDIFWDEVYSTGEEEWHWCRNNEPVVGVSMVAPQSADEPHIGAMSKAGEPLKMHLLTHKDDDSVSEVFCQGAERFYVASCVDVHLKMRRSVLEFFFKTWQARHTTLQNTWRLVWHDNCCLKLCF